MEVVRAIICRGCGVDHSLPRQAARLVDTVPGIRAVRDVPVPVGRGRLINTVLWTVPRIPALDSVRPALTLLEFG